MYKFVDVNNVIMVLNKVSRYKLMHKRYGGLKRPNGSTYSYYVIVDKYTGEIRKRMDVDINGVTGIRDIMLCILVKMVIRNRV